ncbi:olfactory receptor 10AG1-like [Pteropus medius]|uniref:olfactory receptor 10AG1-like n=1 Tax=Pteropus vampyrus TaxID=132908 RepID=UPI00196A9264|nr:olfactory receptor 10AG1-like [Pteropus giganteus]
MSLTMLPLILLLRSHLIEEVTYTSSGMRHSGHYDLSQTGHLRDLSIPTILCFKNINELIILNLSYLQTENQLKAEKSNMTTITEFVLLGFSDIPNGQWILFGIFLVIYLTVLMCNSIIILITRIDPGLQTPMYFFLNNFSFLEICYVTATVPRMLMDLLTQKGNISLVACATQMCFVLMFGASECLLLTVMAYDRYVAICNPLHYPLVMNHKVCVQLAIASWVIGVPVGIGHICQIFSLPFCGSNRINHFFCDLPPVLKLACGDTFPKEIAVYIAAVLVLMVPFLLIVVSYGKIIANIVKISSASGRGKAFSTCSSHLIVVVLFYGTATITYLQPKSDHSEGTGKVISLFYTIFIPTLNPIIYTLRNKDIMMALRKLSKLLR